MACGIVTLANIAGLESVHEPASEEMTERAKQRREAKCNPINTGSLAPYLASYQAGNMYTEAKFQVERTPARQCAYRGKRLRAIMIFQ